jgi:hypothetical protein
VGRKVGREAGATMKTLLAEMARLPAELAGSGDAGLRAIGARLSTALDALTRATDWIVELYPTDPASVAAGSVYYLKLAGFTCGGWMMARAAKAASVQLAGGQGDPEYLRGKLVTARFYADHLLPQADSLGEALMAGGASVRAAEDALI